MKTITLDLYTTNEVCRLTGASYRQLDWWVRTGRIVPEVSAEGSGSTRGFTDEQIEEIKDLIAAIEKCPYHPHGGNTDERRAPYRSAVSY